MPALSLGGMRFQKSWEDLYWEKISLEEQEKVEIVVNRGAELGFHHIETARHYGTSELQLGVAIDNIHDSERLLQSKVPPNEDPRAFEVELELSFERLRCKRLDLLAIHGINLPKHLEQTLRTGGCLEVVRKWQDQGRIGHVGFSTHGTTELIVEAIETNAFDYVNLHWYFIFQDNEPALDAAARHDLGVFIISPTDKGGHLHTPPQELIDLCHPLHPIVFNDLFCLLDPRVHTISVGASKPEDFELHLEALSLLNQAPQIVSKVSQRLTEKARFSLGDAWFDTWKVGLPSWQETPGEINIPVLLWLHNLVEAWDLESYAKSRYNLLGNGGHWFPGSNANLLDKEITEDSLRSVLVNSPWRDKIPGVLRSLRSRLTSTPGRRLTSI